uniref:G_PROTEIN_RECEP_F1_2 domain-containing protein n=1 Tax=Caenorhabditis japonica TaxID=281687 RepID=A0A8R1HM72_CAEJA
MASDDFVKTARKTIRLVHIFFCTMGAISSSLFIYVLINSSSKHLHRNLRISLASLAFAALIACLQLDYIAFYHLVLTLTAENACDSMYEARKCAILRFPVVLSIYATLCGIIVLAIERTIATLKYRTYEANGSRSVAFVLVACQWTVCVTVAIFSVLLRSDPGYVHYCTAYVSHPRTAVFSLCFMSVLEIATLIYFILLLHSNQRRQVNEFVNKAMHSLSERYQLQENVRIMKILIPSITVHAVLGFIGLGSMLVFAIAYRSADERLIVGFAPFSEVVLLVIPVYAVVFPIVAVFQNKQLRLASRKALPFLFNPESQETSEMLPDVPPPPPHPIISSRPSRQLEKDSDTHFVLLNEMWKK